MSQYRVDFESLPWQTPMDGLRFKAKTHNGKTAAPRRVHPGNGATLV